MSCFVSNTLNYGLGLLFGWLIWGRKLRDLRRTAEDHVQAVRAVLGNDGDG